MEASTVVVVNNVDRRKRLTVSGTMVGQSSRMTYQVAASVTMHFDPIPPRQQHKLDEGKKHNRELLGSHSVKVSFFEADDTRCDRLNTGHALKAKQPVRESPPPVLHLDVTFFSSESSSTRTRIAKVTVTSRPRAKAELLPR